MENENNGIFLSKRGFKCT